MALPVIKIENARGQVLNLSADPRYKAILTAGGEPPTATINRNKIALSDGTQYNSATVDERNVVLTVYLMRDIANARRNLYIYAPSKGKVKVYYNADGLDLYIEGYVETVENNPYELAQFVQISIICPESYWLETKETFTDASNIKSLFEFPFSIEKEGIELSAVDVSVLAEIENAGQAVSGARFEITAKITTVNPKIYNLETGEFIGFNTTLQPGDRLIINTIQGQKSVTHIRKGIESNYIDTLMDGSSWLQLYVGTNAYTFDYEEGDITLFVYHTNKFLGV